MNGSNTAMPPVLFGWFFAALAAVAPFVTIFGDDATTGKYRVAAWILCMAGLAGILIVLGRRSKKRALGVLTGGACIGEMAVFSNAPRSATVRAEGNTRTLVLPGDEFKALLMARPAIAQSIIEQLVGRLRGLIRPEPRAGAADEL